MFLAMHKLDFAVSHLFLMDFGEQVPDFGTLLP